MSTEEQITITKLIAAADEVIDHLSTLARSGSKDARSALQRMTVVKNGLEDMGR